jgi:Cu-processing system ATP-binding protein
VSVLVGPNGAGKSTMMGVLLGLLRPDRGQVRVDGHAVVSPGALATLGFRARVGYLPEAVAFAPSLTGREVLRFFADARGVGRERIPLVLTQVGLAHAADRAVAGYSRGMRQRLGLGVAVLHTPELLVLDEPTGGLDQEGLAVLWEVLDAWREAGRAVLLTTHELALIERHADHLCVMKQGRVIAEGPPATLRRQVDLPVRVYTTDEDGPAQEDVAASDLLHRLRAIAADARVRELRVQEPGLDDVTRRILEEAVWDASGVH